jgi:Helix-turn-helix domain
MKSYQYPAAVREHSVTQGAAKHVLLTLATYADDNGECYPSHATLASNTGLSLRTIERVMKEIPADELQVVQKGKAAGRPTVYRITVNPRQADGCQVPNSRQNDNSQDNNSRHGDGSTPVNLSLNSRHGDGLTTNELPIEVPKARKPAPSVSSDAGSREVMIPPGLDTSEFRKSWAEWLEYRKQSKKPLKPLSQQKQLNELNSLGPDRAIAAINHSIARSYQGVFEPRGQNGHKSKLRTPLDESRLPRL